jgi:hypothetical protein
MNFSVSFPMLIVLVVAALGFHGNVLAQGTTDSYPEVAVTQIVGNVSSFFSTTDATGSSTFGTALDTPDYQWAPQQLTFSFTEGPSEYGNSLETLFGTLYFIIGSGGKGPGWSFDLVSNSSPSFQALGAVYCASRAMQWAPECANIRVPFGYSGVKFVP